MDLLSISIGIGLGVNLLLSEFFGIAGAGSSSLAIWLYT